MLMCVETPVPACARHDTPHAGGHGVQTSVGSWHLPPLDVAGTQRADTGATTTPSGSRIISAKVSRPPAGLARIGGPKPETIAGLAVPARRPTDVHGIHCGAITTVRSKRQVVGEFDDANRVGNEVVLAIV